MERLGIARKLWVMLALPLAGLGLLATIGTIERLGVVRAMSRLEDLTSIAVAATQLAHELQRERGMSSRFLGGSLDEVELESQRARTTEAAAAFRMALEDRELTGEVRRSADAVINALDQLPAHRSAVSHRGLAAVASAGVYTGYIDTLLSLLTSVADVADAPSIALRLVSLDALARLKELSGQERASLSVIFSSDRVPPEAARAIAARAGMQQAYEQVFLAHASSEATRLYRDVTAGTATREVTRMRDEALLAALPGDLPATPSVTVDEWWRASTSRIDALLTVEQAIEAEVRAESSDIRARAYSSLVWSAMLALGALFGALALAYWLGRDLIRSFGAASAKLQAAVAQISAFVRQQASSTSETAASVAQTTTTVEEIRKTAEAADERSREMSKGAQASKAAADEALAAVAHGTAAMQQIRSEVESIAQNILQLSEKSIRIGEIVQSVNAIAEQSNLLAVNASIEAAKAAEHGRGFSVVASEVKALALQSKEATEQIRSILGEIQKSSNRAVMITEQGVKRVEEGSSLIEELGRAIKNLGEVVDESADSSSQISLIAGQQLAGIGQITEAMRSVSIATGHNAEGARQLEQTSDEIRAIAGRILDIVRGASERARSGAGAPAA